MQCNGMGYALVQCNGMGYVWVDGNGRNVTFCTHFLFALNLEVVWLRSLVMRNFV